MQKLFIPVILGTARSGRQSEKVAHWVEREMAGREDIEIEVVDVRNHIYGETIPPWANDDRTKPWRVLATRADALLIVSPEYNHGYPGELKQFLDSADAEYHRKPVALCMVSNGMVGGARGGEALLPVLVALQLHPMKAPVFFPTVEKLFDEEGNIIDQAYKDRLKKVVDELVWFAKTLKVGRDGDLNSKL